MAIKGLNLSTETSLKNTTAMIKFQILVQIIHGLKKKKDVYRLSGVNQDGR